MLEKAITMLKMPANVAKYAITVLQNENLNLNYAPAKPTQLMARAADPLLRHFIMAMQGYQ